MSDRGSGKLRTAPPRPHSASGSVWEPQRSVCAECAAWMEVMGSAAGDALGLNASWLFQLHPGLMMETPLLWVFFVVVFVETWEKCTVHTCGLVAGVRWRQTQDGTVAASRGGRTQEEIKAILESLEFRRSSSDSHLSTEPVYFLFLFKCEFSQGDSKKIHFFF